jgi:hypothetical protein
MLTRQRRLIFGGLVLLTLFFAVEFVGRAQQPGRQPAGAAVAPTQPASQAAMDSEREQIWNSPNMLRARAWMQDYFSKSVKVTPEQAKEYLTELQNLTPAQMRLWLIKFDHEEEQRRQQQQLWQQAHAAALSRALAVNQATQRAYTEINRGENQAADVAQQQLSEERQAQQNMAEAKQLEPVGPYGPPLYGGYGGLHYHYHLYPYVY